MEEWEAAKDLAAAAGVFVAAIACLAVCPCQNAAMAACVGLIGVIDGHLRSVIASGRYDWRGGDDA